jgi:hypothetical protein
VFLSSRCLRHHGTRSNDIHRRVVRHQGPQKIWDPQTLGPASDLLQKKPRLKTQTPAAKTSISLRTDLLKSQTVMVLCSQDLVAISIDRLRQNKCRSMGLKGAWEVYISVLAVCLDRLLIHVKCIYALCSLL